MLEGAIDPKGIWPSEARRAGFSRGIAICDRNGLYGVMEFSDACKHAGIQPIIGTLLSVQRPNRPDAVPPAYDWVPLYAQDEAGYENLCKLVSAAHMDRPMEEPAHVTFEQLEAHHEGLIALTGGADGAIVRHFAEGQPDAAYGYADRLAQIFKGRLYIEVCRRFDADEGAAEAELIDLAYHLDHAAGGDQPGLLSPKPIFTMRMTPCCASPIRPMWTAVIASAPRPMPGSSPRARWPLLFGDLPEALPIRWLWRSAVRVMAPKRKPILPSLAGDRDGEAAQLSADAQAGLEARLVHVPPEEHDAYRERLEFEVDVIMLDGFCRLLPDRRRFHQMGQGSGHSGGAGARFGRGLAVVAWALTITDLDPIKLGLLFERFLNPERVSMPDFDIDFCETRRGEVIRYVQRKYGRDQVAQIITFGR
jgi:DNA polymerase-3 subunit alpha